MADKNFEFEIYRLNVSQERPLLFKNDSKYLEADKDIERILKLSTASKFSETITGPKNTYSWTIRNFTKISQSKDVDQVIGITIARSTLEQEGSIVTSGGIKSGFSVPEPPLADTLQLFFYLDRHLVAVERHTNLTQSNRWINILKKITEAAAKDLNFLGYLDLEPVPGHDEILNTFRSFSKLTRFRIILRLPNPELSRYSQELFDQMQKGGIREYTQDMKSPRGLNKDKGNLPHANAEIAQNGYKKGSVKFEGYENNKFITKETGTKATRGSIGHLRDFVNKFSPKTKLSEAKDICLSVIKEINKKAPIPNKK
jgi:hypothetical protein